MEKYELNGDKILKNGHTMFLQDVVYDLNRKAFLESERTKALSTSSNKEEVYQEANTLIVERLFRFYDLKPNTREAIIQAMMDFRMRSKLNSQWISVEKEIPGYKEGVLWLVKRAFGKYTTYHLSEISTEEEIVEYGISLRHLENTDILVCTEKQNEELNLCEYATHFMRIQPLDESPIK